jgi:Tol biopolymer transport system component
MLPNSVSIHKNQYRSVFLLSIIIAFFTGCSRKSTTGIVFSADLDGNQDIYLVQNIEQYSPEKLTNTPFIYEENLSIKSDGSTILYSIQETDLGWDTFLLDMETNISTELNNPSEGLRSIKLLGWSADEKQAVILNERTDQIYTIDIDNKVLHEISIPLPYTNPVIIDLQYEPDGKRLVYTVYHDEIPPLVVYTSFVYKLGTSKATPLLNDDTKACWHPVWSPIGKQILLNCESSFNGSITSDHHVYLLNINQNDPIKIIKIADLSCGKNLSWATREKYSWSPNGKYFAAAYCRDKNTNFHLSIFNSDGIIITSIPQLGTPDHPTYITEIVWSPDGQQIYFIAGESENNLNIFSMDSNGSNLRIITDHSANYTNLNVFESTP